MLAIRLTRVGKKKDASFRVVVIDSKRKIQAGNYLEMVGSYDPRADRAELNGERIKHWVAQGAKPSDTVHNLLISKGIIDGKKINVLPKKVLAKPEAPVAEAVAEAPAAEAAPEAAPAQESAPAETPADAPVAEEKTEEASA
jgi:small subunit ribosomal protein S16